MDTMEIIWKEHHDQLLSFIKRQVKDADLAEDILQDVFVKILSNIDTLKDQSKLKGWIYQLTRNAIYDYFRNKKQAGNLEEVTVEPEPDDLPQAMQEATGWIGFYVHTLPAPYREALVLYELEGLSQKEIAERLNISYVNARSRVQRGRKILKKNLTDCCVFNVDAYGNIIEYNRRAESCNNCSN
ncbi:MAG TPA: RNA polymerase sigma factor SigZ [Prolixibacteraceae bacterium]|nr:RNA polymerase sigma factor SigZ [Prolixibacteraceae bacterium]HCR89495.1 RNA polymerase sigma factor SigZ [Prolixibacteraceae bacterium]HCU63262.1 RNA polymerase sigma factor SigZ [Prolixibacteraceae bacterium]